jgi:adenylate kinase
MTPHENPFRTVLLFGAPGSGKGTQGHILSGIPGLVHLSSGEMFRELDPVSDLGKVFLDFSTRGELVPDDVTVRLWEHHMDKLVATNRFDPRKDTLILDGIPRSRRQAEMLQGSIDVRLLLHLQAANEEQMVQRIRERALREDRLDDANPEVVRRRFREYEAETHPVLEFYSKDLVRTIDAGAAPLEVLRTVIEVLQVLLFPETLQHAA